MSEIAERLEHVLADQVAQAATAVVDAKTGKKRWLFYFEDGRLVGTRSNLKSEGLDALREAKPNLADDRLIVLQVVRRVRGALRAAEEWSIRRGDPKERVEVETGVVLAKGMASARSEDELRGLVTESENLGANAGLAKLQLSDRHRGWLERCDGTFGADALLAAAPGKPAEAMAALFLALRAGALAPVSAGSASAEPDEAAGDGPDGDDAETVTAPPSGGGLSSLIAAGAAEAGVELAPESPEDRKGFIPDEAPKNPNNEVIFDDDIGIEPLGSDGEPVPPKEPAAFPSFQKRDVAPPAATKHPLEDQLRELHARLSSVENHFETLDVAWDAEPEEFRQAHLALAKQLHPDGFADASEELQELASEAFDRVREAWEVLGQEESRTAYIDRVIHGKQTEEELAMAQVEAFWKAESEFKRGLAVFNQGRFKQAHELFSAAHSAVPDELEFRAYFAFTSFKQAHQGNDEEGIESSKEMLMDVLEKNKEQERKLDAGWVLAGIMYRDLGNDTAAKRSFVHALKLNPSNADANRELRRITGKAPGQKKQDAAAADTKKGGFFGRLFGGSKKKK